MKTFIHFTFLLSLCLLIGFLCGKIYNLEKEKSELQKKVDIYKETVKEYQNKQFIPVEVLFEAYPTPKERKR